MVPAEHVSFSFRSNGTKRLEYMSFAFGFTSQIFTKPQPDSGSTGLRYPDQLLALDGDGDGKTDLVCDIMLVKINPFT
jgi:hypothetical protein